MSEQAHQFFAHLWLDYVQRTPSAEKIHEVLGQGHAIKNDHVAFRTFNLAPINLEALTKLFLKLGYFANGEYRFEQKKLRAKHFEHADPSLPKVFVSELLVEEFPDSVQSIVANLVATIVPEVVENPEFLYSGTHWNLSLEEYKILLAESEYAAWLGAFGFCANHFTVSVNDLPGYGTLESVNSRLKEAGFTLNVAGGEIKGSPEVFLEQSSTVADEIDVKFSDAHSRIPSCFYEFARRYQLPNGQLYSGFVTASADKIFESTNVRI